jgi:hypothetical protein
MKINYSIIILNALPDKKIKSLGNKCLIKITKKNYLIDYLIKLLNHIFGSPEIIIVGGYDSKRLKKYVENNFSSNNIRYVEHEVDPNTNIGTSIKEAMKFVNHKNCWIINANLVFNKNIASIINKNIKKSFVMVNNDKGPVGYVLDKHNKLLNCYYDLPNSVLDSLYINKNDFDNFYEISQSKINKLYFFEIINLCIDGGLCLEPIDIPSKLIYTLDSVQNIENIKNKICTI